MAALAGVGAGLGVLGAVIDTKSKVDALNEQAKISDWEAGAKLAEAETIRQSAAFEERQYGRKARLLQGRGVATAAASGLDIKSGTPLFLELDNIKQATIQKLDIRRRGALAAQGRELESAFKRREASFARASRTGVMVGGGLRGASSILSSFKGGSGFGAANDSAAPTTSAGGGAYFDDREGF